MHAKSIEGWSMDKKVTISGIVAIILLSGSVLGVYIKMNERMGSVEIALTYQKGKNDEMRETQKEIKTDTANAINEVKNIVERLSSKVDRLLERR